MRGWFETTNSEREGCERERERGEGRGGVSLRKNMTHCGSDAG